MDSSAEQAFNLLLWFGGGGSIVMTVLWGYAIWKAQKIWRKDIMAANKPIKKMIENHVASTENELLRMDADYEKILNAATGRIDKEIDSLKKEDKTLHSRISDNQKEMSAKIDREVEFLGQKIDNYNVENNKTLNEILAKLGVLEGKLSK